MLRGDWKRAHADYVALFKATDPDEIKSWLDYARLLLLKGDHAGYCQLIPRLIAQCGGKSDLGNPEPEEAQASVLAPGGAKNPIELVSVAERACKDSHNAQGTLWSLSLAHYHAGQWEKALMVADEAIAQRPATAWLSWPILALTHAKLGHADEARALAHQGARLERTRAAATISRIGGLYSTRMAGLRDHPSRSVGFGRRARARGQ